MIDKTRIFNKEDLTPKHWGPQKAKRDELLRVATQILVAEVNHSGIPMHRTRDETINQAFDMAERLIVKANKEFE